MPDHILLDDIIDDMIDEISYIKLSSYLNFDDEIYGPHFEDFAKTIKKYDLTPRIICESAGNMAEDALEMKKIYENLK